MHLAEWQVGHGSSMTTPARRRAQECKQVAPFGRAIRILFRHFPVNTLAKEEEEEEKNTYYRNH